MISRFTLLIVSSVLAAGLVACASSGSSTDSGAEPSRLSTGSGTLEDARVRWYYVTTVTVPPFSPEPTGALRLTRAEAEKDLTDYLDRYPFHRGDVYIRAIDVGTGAILLNTLPWNEGESDQLANKP
jgi:hypothetical protein